METIPTPRSDDAYNNSCGDELLYEACQQLERELHIAKQALEEIIIKGDDLNSDRAALAVLTAENALNEINTLSA